MLFKNDIFHQNNLKLALWQVTNADIRLVLTFDVITNSMIHLSIVAGLVVRHGDLSHEMTMLTECDQFHVSLPSCNN